MPKCDQTQPSVIAVSCPGGQARQFRVQVASADAPNHWKLVGNFRDAASAGHCAIQHSESGQQVRIVACSALPTAA
jgi:hypothetical protein